MLWRALSHIKTGFYVDVGAAWPEEHSVTKAFYDAGWRGINIEPNLELYLQLQTQRPRDQNLQLAIAQVDGSAELNLFESTGLSTLNNAVAAQHLCAGRTSNKVKVQTLTLDAVWEQHVPPDQAVHFLKIDVEGLEEAVLRSKHWNQHRPWVVVVEATVPLSTEENFSQWESLLLGAHYLFAYADGLNRFFVAAEHAELLPAFKYPPNVFDNFHLHAHQAVEKRAEDAELRFTKMEAWAVNAEERVRQAQTWAHHSAEQRKEAETKLNAMQAQAVSAEAAAHSLSLRLTAIECSASWRLTAPLRWVVAQLLHVYKN